MYDENKVKEFAQLSKSLLENAPEIDKLEVLKNVLRFHEHMYYVANSPILSDSDYDRLFNHLLALETAHPDLVTSDSPTQRVANDLNDESLTVKHIKPMLSLANAYNAEDLRDFHNQIIKLTGLNDDEISYTCEPKFDGGSVALVYENDSLIRSATRGNGNEGEEMTNNARVLPSVPLKARFSDYNIHKAELRGEAVIRKDRFEEMNEKRRLLGETLFANPRNTASGGLRTKDPNETRNRAIEIFVFQLGYAVDQNEANKLEELDLHSEQLDILGKLGFKVPTAEIKLCENIEDVVQYTSEWENKRDNYSYEIDGMVVKVNSLRQQNLCGSTAHHPRWAIAYKFKAKQATTTLEDVEYQVGKIGSITPVAKVKPVHIAGVTVSSISMHNEEFITSKDLRIGDKIIIERAGDVIPYIVKSLPEFRDGSQIPLAFPKFCPINKTDQVLLEKIDGEAAWRCPKCSCGAQDLQKMIFHVSKDAMDIDGFGKSYVEKFYALGWVMNIGDIYKLNYNHIEELEGFGKKSAKKLESSIEKAKQNPIQKLLHSLSIHHLGKKASKLLAERIDHVLDLQNWDEEMLTNIPDIGPVVAKNVNEYFNDEENIALLKEMENCGVNMKQTADDKPTQVSSDAPFFGKSILFTGTLNQLKRKEAQRLAEEAGASNISTVSSNLDILVVGEKAGSKLKKAQALGTVLILSESEFIEKLNE